ncbi:MAG TPA: PIN domain-containing protein [archaeon]|nr:PIN domain-containing protein [archaeon]
MPKRLYLDSNVFISFVREEIDSAFNLRYLESRDFFAFCAEKEHTVLISEWFLREVKHIAFLDKEAVFEDFERMKVKTVFAGNPSQESIFRIMKGCGIHAADAVHVAVALENKADFIVTWNAKDFEKAAGFVKPISPSGILDIP